MTLTLNLPPEAEQRLRAKASRLGTDEATAAVAVLADALAWEEQDSEEAAEGIQRGLDDFAAGRHRPFQQFAEEQQRKHGLPAEG